MSAGENSRARACRPPRVRWTPLCQLSARPNSFCIGWLPPTLEHPASMPALRPARTLRRLIAATSSDHIAHLSQRPGEQHQHDVDDEEGEQAPRDDKMD